MKRTAKIATAALACAAALAGSAATAHAANVQNEFSFLQFPAREKGEPPCQDRTIDLNGKYTWFAFSIFKDSQAPAQAKPRERLKLRGRYVWRDCLHSDGRIYSHVSTIRNVKTNGTISLRHIEPGRRGTGTYEWGSMLRKD